MIKERSQVMTSYLKGLKKMSITWSRHSMITGSLNLLTIQASEGYFIELLKEKQTFYS